MKTYRQTPSPRRTPTCEVGRVETGASGFFHCSVRSSGGCEKSFPRVIKRTDKRVTEREERGKESEKERERAVRFLCHRFLHPGGKFPNFLNSFSLKGAAQNQPGFCSKGEKCLNETCSTRTLSVVMFVVLYNAVQTSYFSVSSFTSGIFLQIRNVFYIQRGFRKKEKKKGRSAFSRNRDYQQQLSPKAEEPPVLSEQWADLRRLGANIHLILQFQSHKLPASYPCMCFISNERMPAMPLTDFFLFKGYVQKRHVEHFVIIISCLLLHQHC